VRLRFFYQPVTDVDAASSFYRALGFEEDWRDGEMRALKIPGSSARLLLEEGTGGPGLFLVVEDARAFRRERPDLDYLEEPTKISPGWLVRFRDPGGNVVRVMDDSTSKERQSG
jgi:catechol 2,3-dioxygenase-like lactoylglutathione lyase family enzyme